MFLDAEVENFARTEMRNDLRVTKPRGQQYYPVIFPGFSWGNLQTNKDGGTAQEFNHTPRRGGNFLWRQFFSYYQEGVSGFYGAMFDEVDEGTAWYKVMSSRNDKNAADNSKAHLVYLGM